jgi:hypothetical protein
MNKQIRELILERIAVIRTSFGSDRFGKPNRKGKLVEPMHVWPEEFDFNTLSDEELVRQFERVIYKSYEGR